MTNYIHSLILDEAEREATEPNPSRGLQLVGRLKFIEPDFAGILVPNPVQEVGIGIAKANPSPAVVILGSRAIIMVHLELDLPSAWTDQTPNQIALRKQLINYTLEEMTIMYTENQAAFDSDSTIAMAVISTADILYPPEPNVKELIREALKSIGLDMQLVQHRHIYADEFDDYKEGLCGRIRPGCLPEVFLHKRVIGRI